MDEICASCGITAGDDISLKKCNACKSVRYCSVNCQKEHRPQHKRDCKKRSAELRDELLFKQPESSHNGDCPICLLPLPLDTDQCTISTCCSKVVCDGCKVANANREEEENLKRVCPFCRTPRPSTQAEFDRNKNRRMKANDPVAIREKGKRYYIEGDYGGAIEFWIKAAGKGDIESHYLLSDLYREGKGVEKDEKKQIYHLEEAAIGGHPGARLILGRHEGINGRIERAVKHFIIAANQGLDTAVKTLKDFYAAGVVSKEDFAAALRAYQAAVDATKSPQRDDADAFRARGIY